MSNNRICELRKQKGFSLIDLSILTSLSIGYLCHLEKGSRNNPSMNTMKKICIALGEKLDDVFYL